MNDQSNFSKPEEKMKVLENIYNQVPGFDDLMILYMKLIAVEAANISKNSEHYREMF